MNANMTYLPVLPMGEMGSTISEREGTHPFEVLSLTFFVPMCSLLIWLVAGVIKMSTR